MKLLVMGAGYVGMALLSYFQTQPYEICLTTTKANRVDALKQYGQQVIILNPNDHDDLNELIDSCDGMVILVAPNQGQTYEQTYLNTSKSVATALKGRKRPFYLLYTSSTSVCEGLKTDWVTEDLTPNPQSESGKILFEAEQCYLNSGVAACVLRLGGIYGPDRELLDRARRFSAKEMQGTGNEPTNHIHLEDIVTAISFCLEHSLTGIYHLVNDDHRTRKELYSGLCKSLSIPLPIWNPDLSKETIGGYKISNKKIKDSGFIFKHPLLS